MAATASRIGLMNQHEHERSDARTHDPTTTLDESCSQSSRLNQGGAGGVSIAPMLGGPARWLILVLGVAACAHPPKAAVAPAPAPATSAPPSGPPPSSPAAGEDPAAAARLWPPLCQDGQIEKARAICQPWLASPVRRLAAEGHKCLANVELAGAQTTRIEGDAKRGGFIGPGYNGPGVERAMDHLTRAIALAPEDLSIHEGRLHVAISSPRTGEAPALLADSLAKYTGPDAFDAWLAYAPELADMGLVEIALQYLRVLEKRYPNDHQVVGNIGAFLSMLDRRDEALPYLRRAVELAPGDAIDAWNLAHYLEQRGDLAGAETLYRKATTIESDPERKTDMLCNLGRFLAARAPSRAEGCALARKHCGSAQPARCRPPSKRGSAGDR